MALAAIVTLVAMWRFANLEALSEANYYVHGGSPGGMAAGRGFGNMQVSLYDCAQ